MTDRPKSVRCQHDGLLLFGENSDEPFQFDLPNLRDAAR